MSSDTNWLGRTLDAGLEHGLIGPAELMKQVTANRLAQHLPPALMAKVLQSSLETGAMSPATILGALGTAGLADHLPAEVLWPAISGAMRANGDEKKQRAFLADALQIALDAGRLDANDLLDKLTPELLAEHLPAGSLARLLQAALDAKSMTAALVVETVGVPTLAAQLPIQAVWASIPGIKVAVAQKPAEKAESPSRKKLVPKSMKTPAPAHRRSGDTPK